MSQNAEQAAAVGHGVNYLEIPLCCQFEATRGMFKVLRAKGKVLSSGGFGITLPVDETEGEHSSNKALPSEYLYVEEVVFLHERGLLCCLDQDAPPSDANSRSPRVLSPAHLYAFISQLGMSLPVYFAYAHIRGQDFRVLRYSPDRYDLVEQQEADMNGASEPTSNENTNGQRVKTQLQVLRHSVRDTIRNAPTPRISDGTSAPSICWEAYMPDSSFAKTKPGHPAFYVVVTFYNFPCLTFSSLRSLLLKETRSVPLKVAAVSDSGSVLMFGATDYGAPVRERDD